MPYDPDVHHRRSLRLRGYDYSAAGGYVVTICAQGRLCLFGDVCDGEPWLSDAGRMVERWWLPIPGRFPSVEIDAAIVMPNHLHGIVFFGGAGAGEQGGDRPGLGTVIQWFVTMTTNEYIRAVKRDGWPPFSGKVWQRDYYDHIIRSDAALGRIREYIASNPARWEQDQLHPDNPSKW